MSNDLRRRCPHCKILRKFSEPPGDQGGTLKPRRPKWGTVPSLFEGKKLVCGWCVLRTLGVKTFTNGGITRDVKTGRVLKST